MMGPDERGGSSSDRARDAGDEAVAADDDQFAGAPAPGAGDSRRDRGLRDGERSEPLGAAAEPLDPGRAHGGDQTGADGRGSRVTALARLDVRREQVEAAFGEVQAGPVD